MGNLESGLEPPSPTPGWRCHRCPRHTSLGYQPVRCQDPVKINEPGRLWAMKPSSWFGSHLPPFKNSSVSH